MVEPLILNGTPERTAGVFAPWQYRTSKKATFSAPYEAAQLTIMAMLEGTPLLPDRNKGFHNKALSAAIDRLVNISALRVAKVFDMGGPSDFGKGPYARPLPSRPEKVVCDDIHTALTEAMPGYKAELHAEYAHATQDAAFVITKRVISIVENMVSPPGREV